MDTEVTLRQMSASSGTAARPADEFSGHDGALIEETLHASLDDSSKSPDVVPDVPSLTEQFAGIVYFSEMTADSRGDGRPAFHRNAGRVSGAESVRSTRGRRTLTRPWRLPAVNRNPKS